MSPKLQPQDDGWLLPTPPQASELGLVPFALPPWAVQTFHPALEVWMSRETDSRGADGLAAAASSSRGSASNTAFIIRDGCEIPGARCLRRAATPAPPSLQPAEISRPSHFLCLVFLRSTEETCPEYALPRHPQDTFS